MQFKKSILALSLVCAGSLSASDSNSIKHYGFSALFGYMGETILNKNYKTLDDVETISYGTVLGSLPGLVKELNDAMAPISTNIKFGVDRDDIFYVSVIEAETSKMIRRFPAEQARDFLPKMQEVTGILFDSKG